MYPTMHWSRWAMTFKKNFLFYLKQIRDTNIYIVVEQTINNVKGSFQGWSVHGIWSRCSCSYTSRYFPRSCSHTSGLILVKQMMLTSWIWLNALETMFMDPLRYLIEKLKSLMSYAHCVLRPMRSCWLQKSFKDWWFVVTTKQFPYK